MCSSDLKRPLPSRNFLAASYSAWGFWKSAEYEAAKKLREGKGRFYVTVLEGLDGA